MGAAVAFLVVGTVAGFFLGRLTAPPSKDLLRKTSRNVTHSRSKEEILDADSGSEDEGDQDLQSFEGRHEECKLILVVRTDLGMTKGSSPSMALPLCN